MIKQLKCISMEMIYETLEENMTEIETIQSKLNKDKRFKFILENNETAVYNTEFLDELKNDYPELKEFFTSHSIIKDDLITLELNLKPNSFASGDRMRLELSAYLEDIDWIKVGKRDLKSKLKGIGFSEVFNI